jgi:inosine-uridine nucleoside N-ribohydrolase
MWFQDWRINVLGQVPGPMMELLNKAEAQNLAKLTDIWLPSDALAAAVFLQPEIVLSAETQYVSVEVHSSSLAGACIVDYNHLLGIPPNSFIVKSIDIPALQALLIQYLTS